MTCFALLVDSSGYPCRFVARMLPSCMIEAPYQSHGRLRSHATVFRLDTWVTESKVKACRSKDFRIGDGVR